MDAKSIVAVLLALTVCAAILAPIVARIVQGRVEGQLSDLAVQGLTDLVKVAMGALVGWMACQK